MYKLLIVDDEPLVQVGIKSMIDWPSLQIEVIGTAANGEAALHIIETQMPDIVITDIKMPILSGLELVRICRERYGTLPVFIILTSYEDFAMAKQAISYQVTDYLVKLELDAQMLSDSIRRAISQVNECKTVSEPVSAPSEPLLERFFIRLVNNLFESETEFELQKEELSVSFSAHGSLAGYFQIDTPSESTMDAKQLLNLYSSTLQMFIQLIGKYIDCTITPLDARHFLIVFPLTDGNDYRQDILRALQGTCSMLKNYYNATIHAGIGHPITNPFELSASFYEAKQALTNASDDTPFLFYEDLPTHALSKNVFNLSIFKDDIRIAYEELNQEKLKDIFTTIIELFKQNTAHYVQAMDAAGSVLYLTISLLSDGEQIVSNIFRQEPNGYRSLYQLQTTDQIITWLQTLCDGLCTYFENEKDDYKNHVVSNVKTYIHQNLDQKLTLNEVAATFGISSTYLSSLFGKYSDLGFVNYVNYAKITAAKEMMRESNDKIYEIAERLGFESAFYFSKVFKKVEGCSPREFLQKL
ncbi:MAG: response regulator [Eubacterium sp.]|nr:response regulator [Eubacterium sp.]